MKHFVYLDTDILNSYLSQINDGLVINRHVETNDEVVQTSLNETENAHSKSERHIGFEPIFGIKLSDNPDVLRTTNTLSQTESGRELIEAVLHDNAFNQLKQFLTQNNNLKTPTNSTIGDYVEFEGEYTIRDLDYLLSIYTDEYIEFLGDEAYKNCNGNDSVKKKHKQDEIKKQKNTKRIFEIAKNMLPSSSFMIVDDCFIPINSKYLRHSLNSMRFNFCGKIHVLGRYTSTMEMSIDGHKYSDASFDNIFKASDEVNKQFYTINMGIPIESKILLPIALYFE